MGRVTWLCPWQQLPIYFPSTSLWENSGPPLVGVWCWPRAPLQDWETHHPSCWQCQLVWAHGSVPLWELPSTESCFLILGFPFWEQPTFNHWPMKDRYKVPVPSHQLKATVKGHSSQELPMALAEGSASQSISPSIQACCFQFPTGVSL